MSIPKWVQLSIVSILWHDSKHAGWEWISWVKEELSLVCRAYQLCIKALSSEDMYFTSYEELKRFCISYAKDKPIHQQLNCISLSVTSDDRDYINIKHPKLYFDGNDDCKSILKEMVNNESFREIRSTLNGVDYLSSLIDTTNRNNLKSVSIVCEQPWTKEEDVTQAIDRLEYLAEQYPCIENLWFVSDIGYGDFIEDKVNQDLYRFLGSFKSLKSLTIAESDAYQFLIMAIKEHDQKFLCTHLLGNGIHLTTLNLLFQCDLEYPYDTHDLIEYIKRSKTVTGLSTSAHFERSDMEYLLQSLECTITNLYLHALCDIDDVTNAPDLLKPFHRFKITFHQQRSGACDINQISPSFYQSLNHVTHLIVDSDSPEYLSNVLLNNTKSVSLTVPFNNIDFYHYNPSAQSSTPPQSNPKVQVIINALNKCTTLQFLYTSVGERSRESAAKIIETLSKEAIRNHPSIQNKSTWYWMRCDDPSNWRESGYRLPEFVNVGDDRKRANEDIYAYRQEMSVVKEALQ